MGKQALCVNKAAYLANPTLENLLTLPSYLVDRDIADCKDPVDDVNLQLISYLTIINKGVKLFVYLRGKAGDESSLHNLYSVGVGGHVDEALKEGQTLREALLDTISREIKEEIGFTPNPDTIEFSFDSPIMTLIHEPLNPTNRVHLGINFVYIMNESEEAQLTFEKHVIEQPRWLTIGDINELNLDLEPWSRMVVDKLVS